MKYLSIIYLIFCSISYAVPIDTLEIEGQVKALRTILGQFPPTVKDSTELNVYRSEVKKLIRHIKDNDDKFKGKKYFALLGYLYLYAYNLDVPNVWEKCNHYFSNAIEMDPGNTDYKIELIAFYGGSLSPNTPEYSKYMNKGFGLLQELIKDGYGGTIKSVYWNLGYYSLMMQTPAFLYESINKMHYYFPNDTSVLHLERILEAKKHDCYNFLFQNETIEYSNSCTNFKITYPIVMNLYSHNVTKHDDLSSIIMLETPHASITVDDSIRNSISVFVYEASKTSIQNQKQKFFSRSRTGPKLIQYDFPDIINDYQAFEGYSKEDCFKGIICYIKSTDYLYQIMYNATRSTYDTNLTYFMDFVKSFKLIN